MFRFLGASILLLLPSVLTAQRDADPIRPLLAAADTNDSQAYYDYGLTQLRTNPKVAADAFYWSSRLNPISGDAFYARRVALLLTDRRRLIRYWNEDKGTLRSAEIKRIDSLYLHALTLNPFLYEKLDQHLLRAIMDEIANEESARAGIPASEVQFILDQWMMRAGPGFLAWQAYGEGRFDEALEQWAKAIKTARYKYGYRSQRGRLFFQLNHVDSALSELKLAVEELRKRDAKDVVYLYQSKALFEQTVAMAHERRNETDLARQAYARALQEDLSYSPAHVRLAFLALDQKDTTTALSELDLAVQLRPGDSGLRYQYGFVLSAAQKNDEAASQLKKAIEINPWYALSHHALGALYDRQGKRAEALDAYRAYLALASRNDTRRNETTRRVQTLAEGT